MFKFEGEIIDNISQKNLIAFFKKLDDIILYNALIYSITIKLL